MYMPNSRTESNLWQNLLSLFSPVRGKFLGIVAVSLASTGATLIEPLIYREAINDIAGLFVQEAKDSARQASIPDEEPITNFFQRKLAAPVDTTQADVNTLAQPKKPHTRHHVAGRTPQQAMTTLFWAVSLLFFTGTLGHLLRWIADNMNVRLSCSVEQRFIGKTFAHVLNMPLRFFATRSSAALSKQINQQDQVFGMVNGFSQQILPEMISLLGIVAIMLTQNARLTLIAFSVIPLYFFLARRSANKLEAGLAKYYEEWEGISARIQDAIGGIKTVKLAGAEKRESQKLQLQTSAAYDSYVDRAVLANRDIFLQSLLTRISTAFVLGYGGYLTLQHRMTPGDVVMFVAYLDRLYLPIDSLSTLWIQLQQNIASLTRAFKLKREVEEIKKNTILHATEGLIEFRHVDFSYTSSRTILKDVSFVAHPGKVTAIVGPSGAGKTTAMDLLMCLYQPTGGKIFIDQQDISTCDAASVRRQIGMVAADGAIFRGTLADNIRYKRPGASDTEVKKAAVAAGMELTLKRLPDGLNTLVGEGGLGLSVGERQRIQIARILVSRPRILILDEATANLDFATESEIRTTIHEIAKEHTVIIIAHRYSMVREADHVIVLTGGEVTEDGLPNELIDKGKWFAGFARHAVEK